MAAFYRRQRLRLGLLLDEGGGPAGGRWSFDADNRKRLPPGHPVPPPWIPPPSEEVDRARSWVRQHFPDSPGSDADFAWPVTHAQAEAWLADFLEHRLDEFGPYEDALSGEHRLLFHSGLSVPMNLGLLTPADVVAAAMRRHEQRPVPLASLEGFLRQIIGWREYMRGVYVTRGVRLRTANRLGLTRRLGEQWWTAGTGIPPLDSVIAKVDASGYAHHIERLMVVGNLMLLVGTDPDEVYRWFMSLFVDAYDWVMVPNVYGMSQFSDLTGIVTKPYVSGSNYIRRMGHDRCPPTRRRGSGPRADEGRPEASGTDWCQIWDGLFWRFVDQHRDLFRSNPRTGVLVGNLDRMDPQRRSRLFAAAQQFTDTVTTAP
jgi:deoxyribodipyrimidine photolyase-related protein